MKKKSMTLILLMLFSITIISLMSMNVINVVADEGGGPPFMDWERPPPSDKSGNYWDFDNGTIVGWIEKEYEENKIGERLKIFNISSMKYLINASGDEEHGYQDYYGVMLKQMYWNTTDDELKEHDNLNDFPIINASLINYTTSNPSEKMLPYDINDDSIGGQGIFLLPFIPKNSSDVLDIHWCADASRWFYGYFLTNGTCSSQIGSWGAKMAVTSNSIYYWNNTWGTYARMVYDEHGILTNGEMRAYFGPPDDLKTPKNIDYTRIYDYNPLNELEWPVVAVGDEIFLKNYTEDKKLTITKFEYKNIDSMDGMLAVQVVKANYSRWTGTEWEVEQPDMYIGAANEQNPFVLGDGIQTYAPFIIPKSFDGGPSGYYMARLYDNVKDYFQYDNVTNGVNWVKLYNSTTEHYSLLKYYENGLVQLYYTTDRSMWQHDESGVTNFWFLKDSPIQMVTLLSGVSHELSLTPVGMSGFEITVNITVSSDTTFIFSAFIQQAFQSAMPFTIFYLDLWLNISSISGFVNITITYDSVVFGNIELWWFNESANEGQGEWQQVPIGINGDTITITLDHLSLYSLTGERIWNWNWNWNWNFDLDLSQPPPPQPPSEIPFGYFFLIFMAIGIIGLVIYKKRKI